jgi:hypothetical protein
MPSLGMPAINFLWMIQVREYAGIAAQRPIRWEENKTTCNVPVQHEVRLQLAELAGGGLSRFTRRFSVDFPRQLLKSIVDTVPVSKETVHRDSPRRHKRKQHRVAASIASDGQQMEAHCHTPLRLELGVSCLREAKEQCKHRNSEHRVHQAVLTREQDDGLKHLEEEWLRSS